MAGVAEKGWRVPESWHLAYCRKSRLCHHVVLGAQHPSSSVSPQSLPPTITSHHVVAQSCPTLCDPIVWPGYSVLGVLQARIMERIAMPSTMGSS